MTIARLSCLIALFCSTGCPLPLSGRNAPVQDKEPSVSPAIRALLPANAVVRANLEADAGAGEQVTVYATSSDYLDAEIYVLISRNGRKIRELDVGDIVSSSPVDFKKAVFFRAGGVNQLFFAIGLGVDQAATCFFVLDLRNSEYRVVWKRTTMQGQIVLENNRMGFTLWEACCMKDESPDESCVWCAHRYQIRTYIWNKKTFIPGKTRRTREHIDPDRFAENPIVVSSSAVHTIHPWGHQNVSWLNAEC